ncbi:MAG: cell division protein ZapA [Alphaproteobacteria bacterium]|nr:cell division protein ZapA [Alphaproteobacteria bacterium]
MAQVDVAINGKSYRIACDDGQEDHLLQLAAFVDKRIQELVASVGQIGDARLLVMASLLISDELSETYSNLNSTDDGSANDEAAEAEQALAQTTEALAQRIELIAEKLEPA